jgi:hypothetical protein
MIPPSVPSAPLATASQPTTRADERKKTGNIYSKAKKSLSTSFRRALDSSRKSQNLVQHQLLINSNTVENGTSKYDDPIG